MIASRRQADPDAAEVAALLMAGLIDEGAARRRLGLPAGQLRAILDDIGLSRAAMVPIGVGPDLQVRYADIGHDPFLAPMFDDVVERCASAGDSGLSPRFHLSADAILAAVAPDLGPGPRGLMFHTGRSGSTLLCNLLGSLSGCVTLREPEVLNTVLQRMAAEPRAALHERLARLAARLLESLAHGVRADAEGRTRAAIVKLTSWNAGLADPLVALLDAVPLVALVRDPWETVASFLGEPPHWAGAAWSLHAACSAPASDQVAATRFFAEAWNGVVDAVLRFPAGRTLVVAYADLVADPCGTLVAVSEHFGFACDTSGPNDLAEIMRTYSKGGPGERFDAVGRRADLDAPLRDLVTTLSADRWRRLSERLRAA